MEDMNSEGEAIIIQVQEDDNCDHEPYTFSCSIISKPKEMKVLLKWVFILVNVGIELSQAVLSQEAGDHKIKGNHYRRLGAIFSSACLTLSSFEVMYEAKRDRVRWQRKRGCYCFYYPGEYGGVFGSFSMWFGLLSATLQFSLNIASLVIKRGLLKFDYLGLLLSVAYLIAASVAVGDKKAKVKCCRHGVRQAEGRFREGMWLFECLECKVDIPHGSAFEIENHREAVPEPRLEWPEQLPGLRLRRRPGHVRIAEQIHYAARFKKVEEGRKKNKKNTEEEMNEEHNLHTEQA